jgi:ribonuclease HI
LARNAAIFEDKSPLIHLVTKNIIAVIDCPITLTKDPPTCRSTITLPSDKFITWFDRAAQLDGILCGAGGYILINSHTSIKWTINCGQGTNTKAKLMGVWASLILAHRLNIEVMLLLGDSKVIIDWINGKADLQAIALECWKERTLEATRLVKSLSALHIYREDNRIANILSKQGLSWPLRILTFP